MRKARARSQLGRTRNPPPAGPSRSRQGPLASCVDRNRQAGSNRSPGSGPRRGMPPIPRRGPSALPAPTRESIPSPQPLVYVAEERANVIVGGIPWSNVVWMITEPPPWAAEIRFNRICATWDASIAEGESLVDPEHIEPCSGVVRRRENQQVGSLHVVD